MSHDKRVIASQALDELKDGAPPGSTYLLLPLLGREDDPSRAAYFAAAMKLVPDEDKMLWSTLPLYLMLSGVIPDKHEWNEAVGPTIEDRRDADWRMSEFDEAGNGRGLPAMVDAALWVAHRKYSAVLPDGFPSRQELVEELNDVLSTRRFTRRAMVCREPRWHALFHLYMRLWDAQTERMKWLQTFL